MSDARLRELERRFRASGDVADEVAWINERLRLDDLERRQLVIAAYYGHAASRQVLGEEAPPEALTLIEHCLVIHRRQDACQRALVSLAEATRPEWGAASVAEAALDAAKAFFSASGETLFDVIFNAKKASDACTRALAADSDAARGGLGAGTFVRAAAAPWAAALCVGRGGETLATFLSEAVQQVVAVTEPRRHEELCAAIRRDLIAWALGFDSGEFDYGPKDVER